MSEEKFICTHCGFVLKYVRPYTGGDYDEYQCDNGHTALFPTEAEDEK